MSQEELADTDHDPEEIAQNIAQEADEERPDPADLEPISADEAQYKRDPETGELETSYQAVKYDGDWRRIGIKPLVPKEANELQQTIPQGSEFEWDEITPFLEEYIREPSGVDWDYAKPAVLMPAFKALYREMHGEQNSEYMDEVRKELEERVDDGDGGN